MKTAAFTFLVAFATTLVLSAPARADVLHFVEDFSNEQGDPAFDPMFNHSCTIDDPEGKKWDIGQYLARKYALILYVFSDTVTFNLAPDQYVTRAEVESWTGRNSVKFIGTLGEVEFTASEWPYTPPSLWSATSSQIGPITAIELRASQGYFDNIAIDVVPEPSTLALLATGLLAAAPFPKRRARSWVPWPRLRGHA